VPEETKRYLFHFAIVGGGPTGVGFATQLSYFIHDDMSKLYLTLQQYIKISLLDVTPKSFPCDASLANYAIKTYADKTLISGPLITLSCYERASLVILRRRALKLKVECTPFEPGRRGY
jgi:hypothetical protein